MLAFLGIWECYDPKGELMGGAKEDKSLEVGDSG